MNGEFISVLTYLTECLLFFPSTFVDEVILVDTKNIIKGPSIEFGEFIWFIGIWLFRTSNPGTTRVEYFSKNPIDVFSGVSIYVNQFMSGNSFESF